MKNITQKAKKNAKADGEGAVKERARLHRRQNRTSRNVARQKNDSQKRKKRN